MREELAAMEKEKEELMKPLIINFEKMVYTGMGVQFELKLSRADEKVVDKLRYIPSRGYIAARQVNTFHMDHYDQVVYVLNEIDHTMTISDEWKVKIQEYKDTPDFNITYDDAKKQIRINKTMKMRSMPYIYELGTFTNFASYNYYTISLAEISEFMEMIKSKTDLRRYIFKIDEATEKYLMELAEREKLLDQFADMKDASEIDFVFKGLDENGVPYQLKADQRVACKFDDTFGHRVLITFDMGKGKAQPVDAIVYTPYGPKQIGSLKTGDKVLTPYNEEASIIGVFPQGKVDIYKVTFSDGVSTECCGEHLWNVQSAVSKKRREGWKTKSINELKELKLKDKNGNSNWYIPITQPVDFRLNESFTLPIDPYVLGAILGDGCITDGTPRITGIDKEILNEVKKFHSLNNTKGAIDYRITEGKGRGENKLTTNLQRLGLWGCNSHTKFIPWIYLYTSIEERLRLLQGLMDTDGSIWGDKNTVTEFSSVSKDLIEGVKFLVESLGGVGRIQERKIGWRLNINLPGTINPFKLLRKAIKYEERDRKYLPTRAIVNIEFIGTKEAVCILIDHPSHLYLTNNFIVTHNTAIAIAQAERYNERVLFVCKADLKTNIVREVKKFTGKDVAVFSGIVPDGMAVDYMVGTKKQQYNVINYDIIGRAVKDKDDPSQEVMPWVQLINLAQFDRIIFDECHYMRNIDTQRSKGGRNSHSPKVMLLSGTPIVNRPGEMFPVLNIIAPITFYDPTAFLKQWTTDGIHIKNPSKMHKMLKRYMIRRERDKSSDPNRIPQYTELSPAAQKAYAKVMAGLYEALRKPNYKSEVHNILTEMLRLKQICSDDKVDFTVSLTEDALEETEAFPWNKVLVFSQFKDSQGEIAARLGPKARIINGDVTDKARYEIVDKFQDPKSDVKVIVTNITEGLTLTQAYTTIINDLWWTPKDHLQAEGRAFGRINDPHGGNSYYVLCENTIEDAIWALLEKKLKIIKTVIEDVYTKEKGYEDESLFEGLINLIKGGGM